MESSELMSEKGKKIMAVKQELGPQTRPLPQTLLLTIHLGGKFEYKDHKTEYVGGMIYMKEGFVPSGLKISTLRDIVMTAQKAVGMEVNGSFSMWHRLAGRNLTNGRKKFENDTDFVGFFQSRDMHDRVVLYVVEEPKVQSSGPRFRSKNLSLFPSTTQPIPQTQKVVWPMTKSGSQPTPPTMLLSQSITQPKTVNTVKWFKPPQGLSHSQSTSTHPVHLSQPMTHSTEAVKNTLVKSLSQPTRKSPRLPEVVCLGTYRPEIVSAKPSSPTHSPSPPPQPHSQIEKRSTPRIKHVARKKKVSEKKQEGKKRAVKRLFRDEDDVNDGDDSDSELSDDDFLLGEEDRREDVDDELFFDVNQIGKKVLSDLQKEVEDLRQDKGKGEASSSRGTQPRWEEQSIFFDNNQEPDCDSDEARSLQGSDDEGEQFPTFNPTTDLKGTVKLSLGLKFDSIADLRKAVQSHSIQNMYSFYYLHNEAARFEVYCRHKCECPWVPKKQKIMFCCCKKEELKCHFKIKASKIPMAEQYQIRDINLHHDCGFFHSSNKVTSEFLAGKYMEDWKSQPDWRLRSFMDKVYRDIGIKINYSKAWLTRCRVKQILYGDAREQYAKVYKYANAILKYNPGSTAIVSVENNDSSSQPFFKRFYVCLEACKTGYRQGCRPIIGVDGCHLRGPYPGILLTAISKDGNNNIFPVAWAIVEVENTSTWQWFLELLLADTGHNDGDGLTLMSDRQKGLLEAMSIVAPNADVRFCVRHIWANFKLKFTGTIFKEIFWKAAKSTTVIDFEIAMGQIRFLSEEAFEYLDSIPPHHWSRHAFSTTAKSNMVTNNMCETFNAVIREARDKPVITCLEWIRRYLMQRHAAKWDGVQGYTGRFMPYIGRVLGWIMESAKECKAVHSRTDEWEVDTSDDRMIVNLRENTCSCNHFMLTSIPCAHAFCCIMEKRGGPEDYVHDYYSKERYLKAYSSHIRPMPGFKHWEPSPLPEPLPPVTKNMPGRPKAKKRVKEAGEVEEGRAKKLKKLSSKQKCSNCGEVGHKKVKCKNQHVPTVKKPAKKGGRPLSNDPWVVANRKKKEERAAKMKYVPPSQTGLITQAGTSSQVTASTQHGASTQAAATTQPCASTKAAATRPSSSTTTSRPDKLPLKQNKKKSKSLNDDLMCNQK